MPCGKCAKDKIINNLQRKLEDAQRIEMHRIKFEDYKVIVACEHCYKRGEVVSNCNACGGKGTHLKTKKRWGIPKNKIHIVLIDRDKNGVLRFWEDKSCYFSESEKIVHFTLADAAKECAIRNKQIKEAEAQSYEQTR